MTYTDLDVSIEAFVTLLPPPVDLHVISVEHVQNLHS